MRFAAAPMDLTVKIVTGCVLALDAACLLGAIFTPWSLAVAGLLGLLILYCYLRAPVAYEVSPTGLTVLFRVGSREFGPALRAATVPKSTDMSIRLWGNGGLFAGTGIFWNGTWGVFRAYVTCSKRENMVLVETESGKVLVSPEDQEGFIGACSSFTG